MEDDALLHSMPRHVQSSELCELDAYFLEVMNIVTIDRQ